MTKLIGVFTIFFTLNAWTAEAIETDLSQEIFQSESLDLSSEETLQENFDLNEVGESDLLRRGRRCRVNRRGRRVCRRVPPRRRPPRRDVPPRRGRSYYDWGESVSGWGYCYYFSETRRGRRSSELVGNRHCERIYPSYYDWARGRNGYEYCYQWTPYDAMMNEGRPVDDHLCM